MEGETKCLVLKQFRKCLIFLQKHIRRNNQVVVYEMLPMWLFKMLAYSLPIINYVGLYPDYQNADRDYYRITDLADAGADDILTKYGENAMENRVTCFISDKRIHCTMKMFAENPEIIEQVLFGQCTGATVAYEVVREIRKQYNKAPILFVASGAVSPRTPAISGTGRMTDEELIKFLLDSGRITEESLRIPMFMEYYFPVMKADFAMLEKYKYPGDFMLPCPILTVKGDKDTLATEEEFEK